MPALVADVERTWRSCVVRGGVCSVTVKPTDLQALERDGARGHVRFIRKIELPIVIVCPSIVESEEHARKPRLRSRRLSRLF